MSSSGEALPAGGAVRAGRPRASSEALLALLAFGAALALACLPLLATDTPPLFDYPNHLARVDAMNGIAGSLFLQANFELTSVLIPNVLSDLVLLALMQIAEPRNAGRILLALTFALTLGGWTVLNRVVAGRFSPWPLLVAVFLTNEMFFWGFLNYNLGLALVPFALAAWLVLDRAPAWQRLGVGAVFAVVIFLAHLVAFGLYAVAVAVLELVRAWRNRRAGPMAALRRLTGSALQFAPALLLYWAVSPSRGLPLDLRFDYSQWAKLSPFSRILSSGNPDMDMTVLCAVLAFVALGLLSGRAAVSLRLALVAASFALMVLVFPYAALGSFFLDSRIAIAAAFAALASLTPRRAPLPVPLAAMISAAILLLLGWRSTVIAADWRVQDAAIDRVLTAFESIPAGSLLLPGSGRPFELGDWTTTRRVKPAYEHVAAYAMIDRQALVPNLFAKPGQNPLVYRPALAALRPLDRNPIWRVFFERDFGHLAGEAAAVLAESGTGPAFKLAGAYVIVFHRPCADWPAGLKVEPVACGPDFSLMKAIPAGPAPATSSGAGTTP